MSDIEAELRANPGPWYIKTRDPQGWDIVTVYENKLVYADQPEILVFMTDHEGSVEWQEFEFIRPVPAP